MEDPPGEAPEQASRDLSGESGEGATLKRAALVLFAIVLLAVLVVWIGLPSRAEVRALRTKNPAETSVMRQRDGEARRSGRKPRRDQRWVPLSRISRNLVEAVVASEDSKFFGHEGVDWEALRESAQKNWEKGRFVRGGSTITQQLAKNLFLSTRKTPLRKVREFVVARWLESDLTKRRILEIYLNVIEWGDSVYGGEAAARRYYGKSASDLTVDEAAGLAAMIPNPRRINPRVNPGWHARASRRVLWLMGLSSRIRRGEAVTTETPPPVEPPPGESAEAEVLPLAEEPPPLASPTESEAPPESSASPVPVEPSPGTEPSPAAEATPAAEPTALPEPTPAPTPHLRPQLLPAVSSKRCDARGWGV